MHPFRHSSLTDRNRGSAVPGGRLPYLCAGQCRDTLDSLLILVAVMPNTVQDRIRGSNVSAEQRIGFDVELMEVEARWETDRLTGLMSGEDDVTSICM